MIITKKLILSFIAIVISNISIAQYIILDLKLNDCVSCRSNLFVLKEVSKKVPVFAVFSEQQKNELDDLEYKFTLSALGINYIFNNDFYNKFHKSSEGSNWYYINQNGKVAGEGDLKQIDSTLFVELINKTLLLLPKSNTSNYLFTQDKILIIRQDLDKLQILSKDNLTQIINISAKNFDYNYIAKSLSGDDSTVFIEEGISLNKKVKGFRPGYRWFDINSKNELYGMLEYLQTYIINKDSVSYNIHTALVVLNDTGKIKYAYPLKFLKEKKIDNYSNYFFLKNNHSIIAITHNPRSWFENELKINQNKKIEFISVYTIDSSNHVIEPTASYSFDLPRIYREKYFENYLSPEVSSYPYISFRYANQLYNLETLKSCFIIDTAEYNRHINFTNKEIGNEKYTVLTLKLIPKTNEVLIVYRLEDNLYLKRFLDLKEINTIKIGNAKTLLRGNNVDDCFIDPYTNQIYFTFEKETNCITLPLALYNL